MLNDDGAVNLLKASASRVRSTRGLRIFCGSGCFLGLRNYTYPSPGPSCVNVAVVYRVGLERGHDTDCCVYSLGSSFSCSLTDIQSASR